MGMQPDQQNLQPDYDFILNSGKKKRSFNLGGGLSVTRLIVVVGGFLVLLIIILAFKSFLSGTSPVTADFDQIVEEQSEIIHVINSDEQNQNGTLSSANQAFSETALLTMTSYETSMVNFLSKNGVKVGSGYTNYYSKAVDNEFASAQTSVDFNSVFINVMSQQLITYNNDLTKTYSNVTSAAGRSILQSQYKGTQLLIRELNQQYS